MLPVPSVGCPFGTDTDEASVLNLAFRVKLGCLIPQCGEHTYTFQANQV